MRKNQYHSTAILKFSGISLAILFALSACEGDDGTDGIDGVDGQNGTPGFTAANYILSNNGTDNVGTTDLLDQNASSLKSFNSGNNEGVAINTLGHMTQAGDTTTGSLRTVCNIAKRADNASFNTVIDRELTGSNTQLVNPKGIHISEKLGLTFVADFGAMQVSVYGNQAAGDSAPVATTTTDATPWDVFYDDVNDRLFVALTNGYVTVYDNYVATDFSAATPRTIIPSDANLSQVSVNIHGIVYDITNDKLILSDVGSASDATDGSIFVIDNASTAQGNVTVARSISGPDSSLGNPVDIILTGTDLRVAEKSNNAILIFSNIYSGASTDIAPDLSTPTMAPESLVEVKPAFTGQDISDITNINDTISAVVVSSNPGTEGPTSNLLTNFNAALTSQTASYNTGVTQESMTFDVQGNSYATYDGASSGVLISSKVATSRMDTSFNPSYDRNITGDNTGLISPKGIDVSSKNGLIFVAENNSTTPSILVYSSCASGNAAPLLTLTMENNAQPWDVDYDGQTDKAFVALTNGTIAVFDQVVAKLNAGVSTLENQDRTIIPAISSVPLIGPSNIHGIDYDSISDSLIVSDVGSASDIADGKLYVLNNTASASGLTDISISIAGDNTNLGNPVDIMFTGSDLYVAEKSNNLVMRFDNILSSSGGNISPNLSISYTAPESVATIPASLKNQ
ncbi:hypothetical protein [Paraglaciecola sp. 2405UD69-4]|uniref:hypothetical protein n=1 Tax=Paraglaciecola sp. 2405UD69-4 TaxID=3391836 RepID=UPI0039C8E60D